MFVQERLSRVDFTFDYRIETVDFDEDNFVSRASKDTQHLQKIGSFRPSVDLARGISCWVVYNKVDEIEEKKHQDRFFDLWGCNDKVWRIECKSASGAPRFQNSVIRRSGKALARAAIDAGEHGHVVPQRSMTATAHAGHFIRYGLISRY